jgi:hypothetical protein
MNYQVINNLNPQTTTVSVVAGLLESRDGINLHLYASLDKESNVSFQWVEQKGKFKVESNLVMGEWTRGREITIVLNTEDISIDSYAISLQDFSKPVRYNYNVFTGTFFVVSCLIYAKDVNTFKPILIDEMKKYLNDFPNELNEEIIQHQKKIEIINKHKEERIMLTYNILSALKKTTTL